MSNFTLFLDLGNTLNLNRLNTAFKTKFPSYMFSEYGNNGTLTISFSDIQQETDVMQFWNTYQPVITPDIQYTSLTISPVEINSSFWKIAFTWSMDSTLSSIVFKSYLSLSRGSYSVRLVDVGKNFVIASDIFYNTVEDTKTLSFSPYAMTLQTDLELQVKNNQVGTTTKITTLKYN